MRITISSSSNDDIDEKYKKSAKEVTEFLASEGCMLNWGSGERSIMGICYQSFSEKDLPIYGYTNEKYVDELKNLPKAEHRIFEDTFDLKKNIFRDADAVLCLPGGTGTVSELLAYLEEVRSNDVEKPIIVYNEFGHFDSTLAMIDDLISRIFNSKSIYDYFKIVSNLEEFKAYYYELTSVRK